MEEKYTMDEFNELPEKEKMVKLGVNIANELHSIYAILWEFREKRG